MWWNKRDNVQPSPVGDEALLKIMQNALTIHGMKYVLETVRSHDQSIQLGPLSPATVQDVQDAKDRRADMDCASRQRIRR